MKILSLLFLFASSLLFADDSSCKNLLDHEVRILASSDFENLCAYNDKVIMAVNVASSCGFTYQYEGLEKIYDKYKQKGFIVLGFPSRDFLYQEFKDEDKTKEFCKTTYDVSFPLFATSKVRGDRANSFFKNLAKNSGEEPSWNFSKYLISKNGDIELIPHTTNPDSPEVMKKIEALL